MAKMYNVALINDQCIFDERDDFETVAEAVDWAIGRGGQYAAVFGSTDDPMGLRVTVVDDDKPRFVTGNNKWFNRAQMIERLNKVL